MIGTDTSGPAETRLTRTRSTYSAALYDFREVYMKNARGELVPWMLYDKTLKEVIGEEKTKDYLERLKKAKLNPDQEGAIGQAWTIAAVIAYNAFLRRLLGA